MEASVDDETNPVSRRLFLKTSATAAGIALIADPMLEKLLAAPPPWVRPTVKGLTANSQVIKSYIAGIKAMQALPTTDGRNWIYWASIHGNASIPSPPPTAWATCQHGSFFFLSWHRMYLYWFEKILRKLSKDNNFALPYWDYSDANQRSLPLMFRDPKTAANLLYISQRNNATGHKVNDGDPLPPSAVNSTNAINNYSNFMSPTGSGASFGGQYLPAPQHFDSPFGAIESTPHNTVHGQIGGFGGWMNDPNMAARDPIFWLHHSNIARLLNEWLIKWGPGDPVTTSAWTSAKFTFFNEDGHPVTMTACQILTAATQLQYTYEGQGGVPPQACPTTIFTTQIPKLIRRDLIKNPGPPVELTKPVSIELPVSSAVDASLRTIAPSKEKLVLNLEGIHVSRRPGMHYEVYLGLKQGQTPDPNGPNFVGNITFFSAFAHGGAEGGTMKQSCEVNAAIRSEEHTSELQSP